MDELLFLADAPAPPTPADDALPTSRIQVGKLGRFNHARFGAFHWTPATFASFIKNFRERSSGRIPIDLDHTPDKGGPTEAAGWITALTPEGDKLFADVEWTKAAAQKIRDRAYLFISPTFTMAGRGDDGSTCGPKLIGAALTNRPFLERMAVVSLSADFSDDEIIELAQRTDLAHEEGAAVEVKDTSDSRARMAEPTFTAEQITGLATTFGLAENASPQDIVTAAQAVKVAVDDSQTDDAELERRRVKAKADGDDDRVKGIDREKAKRAGKKTLANDETVITADELTTLQADAAAGRQAAQTLDERDRNDTFTAAMDAGKVGDASRETFNTLWEANRDGAKAFLDGLPAQVSTRPTGSSKQAAGETPEGVDPERYTLDQRADAYMAEHKVDYETAVVALDGGAS